MIPKLMWKLLLCFKSHSSFYLLLKLKRKGVISAMLLHEGTSVEFVIDDVHRSILDVDSWPLNLAAHTFSVILLIMMMVNKHLINCYWCLFIFFPTGLSDLVKLIELKAPRINIYLLAEQNQIEYLIFVKKIDCMPICICAKHFWKLRRET